MLLSLYLNESLVKSRIVFVEFTICNNYESTTTRTNYENVRINNFLLHVLQQYNNIYIKSQLLVGFA